MHLPREVREALKLDERDDSLLQHLQPVPFGNILERGLSTIRGTRVLAERATSTGSSSSTTTTDRCAGAAADTSVCEGSTSDSSTTSTLPIVLGAVIPITITAVIFIILHRRHVKKLANEDADKKHKSLDFGLGDVAHPGTGAPIGGKKGGNASAKVTEMSQEDAVRTIRADRGMSLDMGSSPYLLPPGAHDSRESINSLTKSLTTDTDGDKYRKASQAWGDAASIRSHSTHRKRTDDQSSYAGSVYGNGGDDMNQGLLRNAQRMSRSIPPNSRNSLTMPSIREPPQSHQIPSRGMTEPAPRLNGLSPTSPTPLLTNFSPTSPTGSSPSFSPVSHPARGSSMMQEKGFTQSPSTTSPIENQTPTLPILTQETYNEKPTLPRLQSMEAEIQTARPMSDQSDYGDMTHQNPTLPTLPQITLNEETEGHKTLAPAPAATTADVEAEIDFRRMTMGLRPLPPDDPSDNPEQRANRIRSFYKEYFDDSKPNPTEFQADYDQDYLMDGAMYDPETGQFHLAHQAPYAEGMQRRAMTPPPRFQSAAPMAPMRAPGGPAGPPRAMTSMSGRAPGGDVKPKGPPKKKAPPPAPLQVLPTPHMLKEEYESLSIDFAPPTKIRDMAAGVPQSPKGGLRPYSPITPVHNPVISTYSELAVIPSPHALRKSGTFTSLDFAPPVRFNTGEGDSDAGSIRSNRTGISRLHAQGIRNGAYRLSRVPRGNVGTKDDLAVSLKPTWGLRD